MICEALGGSLESQIIPDNGNSIIFKMKAFYPRRSEDGQQAHERLRQVSQLRNKRKTRSHASLFPSHLLTVNEIEEDQIEEES